MFKIVSGYFYKILLKGIVTWFSKLNADICIWKSYQLASMTSCGKIVKLEEGLAILKRGVTKLQRILEGLPEPQFTADEYINIYTYTSSLAVFVDHFTLFLVSTINNLYSISCILFGCPTYNYYYQWITGVSMTCAPRNLLMIILNSSITNTWMFSMNTLPCRWVNVVTNKKP